MYTKEEIEVVNQLLRRFGITPKYKGYQVTIDAIQLYHSLLESHEFVKVMITKDVYPTLAGKYKYETVVAIEWNLRSISNRCWTNNKVLLESIAGYPLQNRPTNTELLNIFVNYIECNIK